VAKRLAGGAKADGSDVERFKVARGAVQRIGTVIPWFLAAVFGWLGVFIATAVILASKPMGASALVLPAGIVTIVATLLVYMNMPGWLYIGSDGVRVDLRDHQRFVRFEDLEEAPVYRRKSWGKTFVGVALHLQGGERVEVPIGEDQFGASDRAHTLSKAIAIALERYRRAGPPDDASALARGSRSPAEWATALRGLGAGANAGPREAPIDPDRLLRIAEDPGAAADARAGAAFALVASLDDDKRERLRIAAAGTASTELKGVLLSAADGDEEGAVAALDRVRE
jgi:hypothetical protein